MSQQIDATLHKDTVEGDSDSDSEDNLPLSSFQKRKKLLKQQHVPSAFSWMKKDTTPKSRSLKYSKRK